MRQLEYSLESNDGTKPSIGLVIIQALLDDAETRDTAILMLRKDHPEISIDDYHLNVIWKELTEPSSP